MHDHTSVCLGDSWAVAICLSRFGIKTLLTWWFIHCGGKLICLINGWGLLNCRRVFPAYLARDVWDSRSALSYHLLCSIHNHLHSICYTRWRFCTSHQEKGMQSRTFRSGMPLCSEEVQTLLYILDPFWAVVAPGEALGDIYTQETEAVDCLHSSV